MKDLLRETDDLPRVPGSRIAVMAVGGNALIRPGQVGTHNEQIRAADKVARNILALVREGYRVVVVHGNGPQVGRELIRSEEASTKVPPHSLDTCVAATQGHMGDMLMRGLRNQMKRTGLVRPLSTLVTQVLVSEQDPAFHLPTKPVGPFLSAWRAKEVARSLGHKMVEDAGRGWRRVVPSPKPLDIFGLEAVETLLEAKHIVIAGGGGGIPLVVNPRGQLTGVDAVIDKDRTAALIAGFIGADVLVMVTAVDNVYVDFGKPEQRALEQVTAAEMRHHLHAGHFATGSMGPKVESALFFIEEGGAAAIITSPERLVAALNDRAGTRMMRSTGQTTVRTQLRLFDDARPGEPVQDESRTAQSTE